MSIEDIKNIFEIAAILLGAIFALQVYRLFSPVILLEIKPEWIDKKAGLLKINLQLENKSRVKAHKKVVYFQYLEYTVENRKTLSEWVPMHNNSIIPGEEPNYWRDPIEIFKSTLTLYPGEVCSVDYLCTCPPGKLLHILLQYRTRVTLPMRIGASADSWATTRIISNTNVE
jgi:hypothetical protein